MLATLSTIAILAAGTPAPIAACKLKDGEHSLLIAGDEQPNPGALIHIRGRAGASFLGYRDIPVRCLPPVKFADPSQGKVIARGSIRLSKELKPGDEVVLHYGDRKMVIEVTDPRNATINVTTSVKEILGCSSPKIGEVSFRPTGRFSVTFRPFESYEDYWGSYFVDPDTHEIALTVEGGNRIPLYQNQREQRGKLVKNGDSYILSGVNLGEAQAIPKAGPDGKPDFSGPNVCTYRF